MAQVGWPDLANKNPACPVEFEFQINNESIFFFVCPEYCFGYTYPGCFVSSLVTLHFEDPRFESVDILSRLKCFAFNHMISNVGKIEETSQMGKLGARDGKRFAQSHTAGWDRWPWGPAPDSQSDLLPALGGP